MLSFHTPSKTQIVTAANAKTIPADVNWIDALRPTWGMNFKNMPEYDWSHGYQFGLCVIALSAIIPFVWFKRRGWW
jgi:Mg2+ and Co2+ transporter CorA